MKYNPKIFREAAARIAPADDSLRFGSTPYACCAIRDAIRVRQKKHEWWTGACMWHREQYVDLFAKFFKPRRAHRNSPWFDSPLVRLNQERRIFALLFMEQIAKDL